VKTRQICLRVSHPASVSKERFRGHKHCL